MPDNPEQNKPAGQYRTFAEFWPYYLSQHSKRETRYAHIAGTLLGTLFFLIGIVSFKIGWIILALLVGYGAAWTGHAFVENNQPATFENPLMSLRGDYKMVWLWLNGKLAAELATHNIST
jgi:hypothetical protein